jgi:acetoin:2,6-dichlorophenolindophenol oxidoreductase subunit beta
LWNFYKEIKLTRSIRYLKAVQEALSQEMTRDENVIVMGEDVRHSLRGITKGFYEKFGAERVIDSPISELTMVGCGTGAAISGLRPVLEFQLPEFVFFAFDQIVNQAQKLRYMTGGKLTIPVTYLVPGMGACGAGLSGQHSDTTYPYVLQAGLKVVMPSSPYDAKGLLTTAIRDNDPVMVYLPARLLPAKGEVPEESYSIPLGKGVIKKEGKDITIVATGHLVNIAIEVAEEFDKKGVSVEVLDPRTLYPLDKDLIKESVSKTGRVIIFDDSIKTCGYASEISAIIGEEVFDKLKAPIRRICRANVPVPFSTPMECYVMPDKEKLVSTINQLNS